MIKKKRAPLLDDRQTATVESLSKAAESREAGTEKYVLRLYISGHTPQSRRAIEAVKNICEQHLKDRYELEIVDVHQQPFLARDAQIVAAPTLVKKLPPPLRRLIGDMTNREHLLVGLDLRVQSEVKAQSDAKPEGTK